MERDPTRTSDESTVSGVDLTSNDSSCLTEKKWFRDLTTNSLTQGVFIKKFYVVNLPNKSNHF